MRRSAPRRGIPWANIPANVNRVLFIRLGVLVTATDEFDKWGKRLWVATDGRKYAYVGPAYVKPVYKYAQIFGGKK